MDVSIILVNYKTSSLVIGAIESIIKNSCGFSYEIIVVDNASNDNSRSIIENKFSDIVFLASSENLGTSKAYNLAITKSKGDFIFLLNPDTVLLNNAISMMLNFIKNRNDVAVVCGNLYDLDNLPTHSYQLKPVCLKGIKRSYSLFYLIGLRFKKNKLYQQFNFSTKPVEVGYACAAAMMMNKALCEKVGFFDERVFMYGEESVLSQKLRNIGLITMNIPEPRIMHFEGGSFAEKKQKSFSESWFCRYIDGNFHTFEILEGPGSGVKYYKILLRGEKKLSLFYFFLNRQKYLISKQKISILKREITKVTQT